MHMILVCWEMQGTSAVKVSGWTSSMIATTAQIVFYSSNKTGKSSNFSIDKVSVDPQVQFLSGIVLPQIKPQLYLAHAYSTVGEN